MTGPVAQRLNGGTRLHLQHGPIDLIIGADGDRETAFALATDRFFGLLDEMVKELPLLRRELTSVTLGATGDTARIMFETAQHFCAHRVTPMICVAGSVAQTILDAMMPATLTRAYVNNGGDIALYLTEQATFRIDVQSVQAHSLGSVTLHAGQSVRGIATSGRHGRSFSLGIADSVTVLAKTAALADAAATLIANAVDLPEHPSIFRSPARDLQPDSDLGQRLVVTEVATLSVADSHRALTRGVSVAQEFLARGLIENAALFLNGQTRVVGPEMSLTPTLQRSLSDA